MTIDSNADIVEKLVVFSVFSLCLLAASSLFYLKLFTMLNVFSADIDEELIVPSLYSNKSLYVLLKH